MKKQYVIPTMEYEMFVTNEYVAACYACLDMGSHSKNFSAIYKDLDKDGILDEDEKEQLITGIRHENDCGQSGSGGKIAHYISEEQLSNPNLCTFVIIQRNNGDLIPAVKIEQRMSEKDSSGGSYPHFCDLNSNASN